MESGMVTVLLISDAEATIYAKKLIEVLSYKLNTFLF
jgi:hypothetical protein